MAEGISQVRVGGHRPIDVERETLVGHRHIQNSVVVQHPHEVQEGLNRILTVLEKVVCNNEILGTGLHLRKRFPIVDEVRRLKRLSAQFWVVRQEVGQRHSVHVGDRTASGDVEASLEGTDLQAGTSQEPRRQVPAYVGFVRRGRHTEGEQIDGMELRILEQQPDPLFPPQSIVDSERALEPAHLEAIDTKMAGDVRSQSPPNIDARDDASLKAHAFQCDRCGTAETAGSRNAHPTMETSSPAEKLNGPGPAG